MMFAMTGKDFSIEETAETIDDASLSEVSSDGYKVSLIHVLTQLAYRKWLIAKVTGVAVLIGLVLCFVLPVRYSATTKIMPPQQTQSTASMLMMNQLTSAVGGGAALVGGGLGLKNPNDIYIGLLTSRPVADAIIQKFSLMQTYHAKDMTAARKKLASYTKVISEKSGFIAVSVTDKDKKRVAEMANAYTDQLRVLTQTLAVTEASQRRLFYEEQLKQAKHALVAAELAFQQVQQNKGLVALDAQTKSMIESLALLHAQITAKQVELQALRSYSTEHNPDVQLTENELSSLQSEAAAQAEQSRAPGFANLSLKDVPSAGLDYLRAEHEFLYQQTLYDLLIKQYDAARLDDAKEAVLIQVVEPAIPPDRKASPRRTVIVLWFAMLGFIAACIYIVGRERVRHDQQAAQSWSELRSALSIRSSTRRNSRPQNA